MYFVSFLFITNIFLFKSTQIIKQIFLDLFYLYDILTTVIHYIFMNLVTINYYFKEKDINLNRSQLKNP